MSQPWWAADIGAGDQGLVSGRYGRRPLIMPGEPAQVAQSIRSRRAAFVPEWADPPDIDAGGAFVRLFSEMASTVLQRLNQLPDKAMVEFFQATGVQPSLGKPAEALVQFKVAPAASSSVAVPKGFQLAARGASGGGLVVFETQADMNVAPADVSEVLVDDGAVRQSIKIDPKGQGTPFPPFGNEPQPGNGLLIGLSVSGDATPGPTITLGLPLATAQGTPLPASSGGTEAATLPPAPLLRWEAYTGFGFTPLEVVRDETLGLRQSGVVELNVPARWDPAILVAGGKPLRWLRLRLLQGAFSEPPLLKTVLLNVVRARAVRTVRNEVLQPLSGEGSNQMVLSQTPVIPHSVTLEAAGPFGAAQCWTEVDDLAEAGPTDAVFTLDPELGVVTFGDGVHGAVIPPGFRNVVALSYEVGSGSAGHVPAGAISTLLQTAPFLTSVINPFPAEGGTDPEAQEAVIRSAPQTIQTRGRAVTTADYGLLARSAPGAEVSRAFAIAGAHPDFPGRPMPGVVQVLVVPPAKGDGPPTPDGATLEAVASYLASKVAPAGVQVVASAPRYRMIRTVVRYVSDPTRSTTEVTRSVIDLLNSYLDPLTGGEQGGGWPFSAPLVYSALLRRLMSPETGIREVAQLSLIVDGVPQPDCADVSLGIDEIFWPAEHDVSSVNSRGEATS